MDKCYFILFIIAVLFLIYMLYNNKPRKSLSYDREKIYEFNDLLNESECNQIISMAKPNLQKSTVLSKDTISPGRTSSHVFLKSDTDLLKKIDKIVFSHLNIPPSHYEELQVVNYKTTQKYNAHYDTCDINDPICIEDTNRFGSLRYATFIIYLNDDFTGGETEFPKHNIKVKPKIGKAVLFFNLNDDNTDRRINSFHGGLPPTTGEKWMCNKWIRLKPIKGQLTII